MRIRIAEPPPDEQTIRRIVASGATSDDVKEYPDLLKRLRRAFYLDIDNRPLNASGRLLEQYRADGLTVFFGAGVSVESQIPGWPSLAERVLRAAKAGLDYRDIQSARLSLIAQFDLAQDYAGDRKRFLALLYGCLYKDLAFKPLLESIPKPQGAQFNWEQWPEVLRSLRANRTLEAIGELLVTEGGPGGSDLQANRQIHGILTTNTDNLLEIYCIAKTHGKRRLLTMVDRASVGDHPETISIHHLHGSLDVRGENFLSPTLTDDLLPYLVFGESEYHAVIADPAAWVNHTPQSYFRTFNVLFVGVSLDDLNIRRWLSQSCRERKSQRERYLRELYQQDYRAAACEAELQSIRHFWLRTTTKRVDGRDAAVPTDIVEASMKHLGVQPVWCRDYAEMQAELHVLKKRGANPSFGVAKDLEL